MRSRLLIIVAILVSLAWTPTSTLGAVLRHSVQHRPVRHHVHQRYYIRHRTKLQHLKIIGGTAKTGATVGGLVGGPPGMAVGAGAGAAVGTAYDLKTRKVKVKARR